MQSSLSKSKRSPQNNTLSLIWIIILVLSAFYAGILVGMKHGKSVELDATVERRVKTATQTILKRQELANKRVGNTKRGQTRFPIEMSRFAFGAARTTRKEFLERFDGGFPEDIRDEIVNSEVLILYNNKKSVPSIQKEQSIFDDGDGLPKLSVDDATKNCQNLHIVSTKAMWDSPQCLAIVGQYASFHIHQWMRIDGKQADMSLPLKPVSRGQMPNGKDEFAAPGLWAIRKGWDFLSMYMKNFAQVTRELRPILSNTANANKTVIVMVSNLGHSDLLVNFVCNAKAKNLDLSNILVFVTDNESYIIARRLGLAAYHDTLNFAKVSVDEAKIYGDATFRDMMLVKVSSTKCAQSLLFVTTEHLPRTMEKKASAVQLVNFMGYNVLFQDLDIVWYRNPLPLFEDKSSPLAKFDILFQDDGARSIRFAPFAANSGFFFVRCNPKTRYLFVALLYNADLIATTGSHQQALIQLITEHSSLYGLRVKTISGPIFPGGYHYHRKYSEMKEIILGQHDPYIFHMCWTHSKKDKILFLQQLGMWFINEQCEGDTLGAVSGETILQDCCISQPRVICHFSDKPSVINCTASPVMDKGAKSFW